MPWVIRDGSGDYWDASAVTFGPLGSATRYATEAEATDVALSDCGFTLTGDWEPVEVPEGESGVNA